MICRTLKRNALVMMPAIAVALFAAANAQAQVLTVTNGNFSQYSGVTPGTNGDYFNSVNPTGWTGGGGLIFVNNYAGINNPNLYLPVWGPAAGVPASPSNPFPSSPIGGNFVEADGNPLYEDSFSYQLHGLTPGTKYSLSFFQAAGQQSYFYGATTNQWIVGLGVTGSVFNTTAIGGGFDQYAYSDVNGSVAATSLMSVPAEGVSPWEQVTVSLTADDPNDVLTFLAWGDNGNTANLPPIAFLDIGANGNAVTTPEPAGLSLMVIGMIGFGAYRLRRRAKLTTI
jgi:hypothetical protein